MMETLATILGAMIESLNKDKRFSEHTNRSNLILEYEYDYISYKIIFYLINMITSTIAIKILIGINDKYEIWNKYHIFIICILLVVLITTIEFLYMSNKYKKLKKICILIKEDNKKYILSQEIERDGFVKCKLKGFIAEAYSCALGILLVFRLSYQNSNVLNIIVLIAMIVYICMFIYLFHISIKYKNKYFITKNLVIRADFRKIYDCLANIILDQNVKIKIENGIVHLYKRKNTLIYLFPQEYLIDIQTWCKLKTNG